MPSAAWARSPRPWPRPAAAKGVDIRTDAPVREVLVEKGRAAGVACENGEVFRAPRASSPTSIPSCCSSSLVDPAVLPADFRERIARYRSGSGTFRMNVALSELPRFTCLPEPGDHLTAGIIIAPSLAYMDQAYDDARATGWSKEPIVEMLIPSTLDDSLAPHGAACRQPVLPACRAGAAGRRVLGRSPRRGRRPDDRDGRPPCAGIQASVIGRQVLSPLDLERIFGLTGGDIMHGRLELDQLFAARPVLGHGNYRAPLRGLYLCGSGTHPGGGVTGAPGHNAAREILRDLKR